MLAKEQGLFFKEPNNKTSQRALVISPEVIKALKEHQIEQKGDKLVLGGKYQDNNLVCCLQDGSPVNPATVSKRFQEVVRKAGINVTFYGLRHAHVSYLLRQGEHPKVVSEKNIYQKMFGTILAPKTQSRQKQKPSDNREALIFPGAGGGS